jgi:hypothetical protein
MTSVETAITRVRRDLTRAGVLKWGLLLLAVVGLFVGPLLGIDGIVLVVLIAGVWLVLSFRSVRGSRMAAGSPLLIASGQFEQAEERIDAAIRSFSLFRTVKLLSLHHLALLRHAQKRWREAAVVSEALLRQRLGALQGLSKSSQLILADSLLEMGDVAGAYRALSALYQYRLSLSEGLSLLASQVDYESRLGAWGQMMQSVGTKVQMAELMATWKSARTQALLGLAALQCGNRELADWLARRAELLVDRERLVAERPMLRELWRYDSADGG